MKKSVLGRGLDVLLPEPEEENGVQSVSVYDIDNNPGQPRKHFPEESLSQLAESIRSAGVIQPLVVTRSGDRYRIIAGERRFRAARLAGLKEVPVIVREANETEEMEIALIENLQREDLNPLEEAAAIRALIDRCRYTQETAAKRLGKSRSAVANSLRLLSLPESVRQLIEQNLLSAGHARALCAIEDPALQASLAEKAVRLGLSVRDMEALASSRGRASARRSAGKPLSLELKDMENRLGAAFGVKATIAGSEKKGKITFSYHSREELDSIYSLLEKLEE